MLTFKDEADLRDWLQFSSKGRGILMEALYSKKLWQRVLIKAYADGWLEVYGERHTLVHIIELPNSTQRLSDTEAYCESKLPYSYHSINSPVNIRATAKITPGRGYHQFMAARDEIQMNLSLIEGCNRVSSVR